MNEINNARLIRKIKNMLTGTALTATMLVPLALQTIPASQLLNEMLATPQAEAANTTADVNLIEQPGVILPGSGSRANANDAANPLLEVHPRPFIYGSEQLQNPNGEGEIDLSYVPQLDFPDTQLRKRLYKDINLPVFYTKLFASEDSLVDTTPIAYTAPFAQVSDWGEGTDNNPLAWHLSVAQDSRGFWRANHAEDYADPTFEDSNRIAPAALNLNAINKLSTQRGDTPISQLLSSTLDTTKSSIRSNIVDVLRNYANLGDWTDSMGYRLVPNETGTFDFKDSISVAEGDPYRATFTDDVARHRVTVSIPAGFNKEGQYVDPTVVTLNYGDNDTAQIFAASADYINYYIYTHDELLRFTADNYVKPVTHGAEAVFNSLGFSRLGASGFKPLSLPGQPNTAVIGYDNRLDGDVAVLSAGTGSSYIHPSAGTYGSIHNFDGVYHESTYNGGASSTFLASSVRWKFDTEFFVSQKNSSDAYLTQIWDGYKWLTLSQKDIPDINLARYVGPSGPYPERGLPGLWSDIKPTSNTTSGYGYISPINGYASMVKNGYKFRMVKVSQQTSGAGNDWVTPLSTDSSYYSNTVDVPAIYFNNNSSDTMMLRTHEGAFALRAGSTEHGSLSFNISDVPLEIKENLTAGYKTYFEYWDGVNDFTWKRQTPGLITSSSDEFSYDEMVDFVNTTYSGRSSTIYKQTVPNIGSIFPYGLSVRLVIENENGFRYWSNAITWSTESGVVGGGFSGAADDTTAKTYSATQPGGTTPTLSNYNSPTTPDYAPETPSAPAEIQDLNILQPYGPAQSGTPDKYDRARPLNHGAETPVTTVPAFWTNTTDGTAKIQKYNATDGTWVDLGQYDVGFLNGLSGLLWTTGLSSYSNWISRLTNSNYIMYVAYNFNMITDDTLTVRVARTIGDEMHVSNAISVIPKALGGAANYDSSFSLALSGTNKFAYNIDSVIYSDQSIKTNLSTIDVWGKTGSHYEKIQKLNADNTEWEDVTDNSIWITETGTNTNTWYQGNSYGHIQNLFESIVGSTYRLKWSEDALTETGLVIRLAFNNSELTPTTMYSAPIEITPYNGPRGGGGTVDPPAPTMHDVNLHFNGAGTDTTLKGTDNEAYTPPTPNADGGSWDYAGHYTFGGWFTNADLAPGHAWVNATPLTSDITLYAKWTQDLTVHVDESEGLTYVKNQTYNATPVAVEELDDKAGFTKLGYYDNEDGDVTDAHKVFDDDGTPFFDNTTFFTSGKYTYAHANNPPTVYPRYEAIHHTVTFHSPTDGATGVPASPVTVDYGDHYTPPTPTSQGYTFAGWYTNADLAQTHAYDPAVAITANVNLYAKWTQTLNFVASGNINTFSNAITQTYGQTALSQDTLAKIKGYTITGYWDTAAATGGNKIYDGNGTPINSAGTYIDNAGKYVRPLASTDNTLYARTTPDNYSIVFDANGGSNAPGTITVAYNSTIADKVTPIPTSPGGGKVFVGWFTDPTTGVEIYHYNGSEAIRTGNYAADFAQQDKWIPYVAEDAKTKTLYAHWAQTWTATYELNGGALNPPATSQVVEAGANIANPGNPTKDGYSFDTWYHDAAFTDIETFGHTLGADETIYAKYSQSILLNNNANGGSSNGGLDVSYKAVPGNSGIPTKEGAVFSGYYTTQTTGGSMIFAADGDVVPGIDDWTDGSGRWIREGNGPTLYARYTTNTYTVYFEGAGVTNLPLTKSYNDTITLPDPPSRPGFAFAGWSITGANQGITRQAGEYSNPIRGDVTVTAMWENGLHTVTFMLDGGSLEDYVTPAYRTGDKIANPGIPVKPGYDFAGWFTSADTAGDGSDAYDFDSVISAEDNPINIYAHWTAHEMTVTLNQNGATTAGPQTSFTVDFSSIPAITALTPVNEPKRTGYTFNGYWTTSTSEAGVQLFDRAGVVQNNVAGWTDGDGHWINPNTGAVLFARWTANFTHVTFVNDGAPGGIEEGSGTVSVDIYFGQEIQFIDNLPVPVDDETVAFNGYFITGSGRLFDPAGEPNANLSPYTHKNPDANKYLPIWEYTGENLTVTAQYVSPYHRMVVRSHGLPEDIVLSAGMLYDVSEGHQTTPHLAQLMEPSQFPPDAVMTWPGYTFGGWYYYTDPDTPSGWTPLGMDDYITTTSPDTIYAQFNPIKYDIVLRDGTDIDTVKVDYNTIPANVTPYDKPGYRFQGWEDINGNPFYDSNGDLVITGNPHVNDDGKWIDLSSIVLRPVLDQIVFDVNVYSTPPYSGGDPDSVLSVQEAHLPNLDSLDSLIMPNTPEQFFDGTRGTYVGWYTDPACTTPYTGWQITADISLYAKYKSQSRITFFNKDGVATGASLLVPAGEEIDSVKLAGMTPTRPAGEFSHFTPNDQYEFLGWYTTNASNGRIPMGTRIYGGDEEHSGLEPDGNLSVIARWRLILPELEVLTGLGNLERAGVFGERPVNTDGKIMSLSFGVGNADLMPRSSVPDALEGATGNDLVSRTVAAGGERPTTNAITLKIPRGTVLPQTKDEQLVYYTTNLYWTLSFTE
ncbi:MAG: InlB B-repeat-containing protein [Lactobacillales bacterium]|jgi:uncharacterized repeat protein (TIGR02543 family)|nr:InlB B-repeat-containing protein [Lactobacillales bacterium]